MNTNNTNNCNLVKMDENKFAYRLHYHVNWITFSSEKVEKAFAKHFPGQEFDMEKAAIALNLEYQGTLF